MAYAQEPTTQASYKFTAGLYHFSQANSGWDLNLRQTSRLGNIWIGYFRLPSALADNDVAQARIGWDRVFGSDLRITPSIQYASAGFWLGSIQAEIGEPWFVGVGLGRTNQKPYFNLNFDPNDAYTINVGRRSTDNQLYLVQYVRDNREHPDQKHVHFIYRTPLQDKQRFTLDVLYKTGLVEDQKIQAWGLSLGYDWPSTFIRLAWDPKANFTNDNSLRFSFGTRF